MTVTSGDYKGPVTAEELDELRHLHAQGLSRNEIARRLDRGQRTVSVYAARLGLSFACTVTEEATRVRKAQLEEKRVILADALTDDALRLSAQVWEPTTIHSFGGKDHTYNSQDINEPPAADKRALMAAATAAAAQSVRLVPPAEDSGAADARSMLGRLFSGLAEVVKEEQGHEEADGESP
ncbi:hypothetical protein OOK31_25510 [Streptomyces sp. NBC_00249]|uniref:hypothetical protein n=1 Tax=Streptomyces sp. NBC_00249 TaxID=2975690 RepID=UPI002256C7B0|nr:hypothetical protein [Streptomyces sp. NBC_00249]MCX5197215.1 hypothetical protein [Streptomyces sp. NBC_00249]